MLFDSSENREIGKLAEHSQNISNLEAKVET